MKEVIVTRIKGTVQLPSRIAGGGLEAEIDLEISVPIGVIHVLSAVIGGAWALPPEEMERVMALIDKVIEDNTTS